MLPSDFVPTRILVTGATGLLGATLTRRLVDDGETVRILRRESSTVDLLGPAAATLEHAFGDITDPSSLAEAMQGVSHVYHVAASLGSGRRGDRARLMEVNVEGTAHVVNAALRAGVERLVHTSSMAAFGRPTGPPSTGPQKTLDETSEWSPSPLNGPYAESKYLSELEVQRGVAEGLDAVVVNPALIFGPGRAGENTVRIAEMVRDRRLHVVPTGGTNVVDARDVADGMVRAMAHGTTGERYFLGGANLAWTEILGTLAAAFGVPAPTRVLPPHVAFAAGVASEAVAMLTGREPAITRERARQMSAFYHYTNARARADLGCTFRPFAETAATLASAIGRR